MSVWKLLLAAIAALISQALSQVQKLSSLPAGAVHGTDGRVWVPYAPSEDGNFILQGPGGYGQIGQNGLAQYGQYGPSQGWQSDPSQSGNYSPPQTGGSYGPPQSGQFGLPQTGYNSYSLNSRYDPYPNYNSIPGYKSNPDYGSYPGYKSNPDYGSYPGYKSNPDYGSYPGYGSNPVYGSFRISGSYQGYGSPLIKPYPFPFPFLQSTASEAVAKGALKPTLEDIFRFMVQMIPLKPVQVKLVDILGSTDPPAVPLKGVSESGNPDLKLGKEGLLEETKSSGDAKEKSPEGDTKSPEGNTESSEGDTEVSDKNKLSKNMYSIF